MRTYRQIRLFSLFLSIIVLTICFPPLNIKADTTDVLFYSVEDGIEYEVTVNVTSTWQDHANIDLVVTNIGASAIEDWYLTFSLPYTIENIWNAQIVETNSNGTYTIKNAVYNQDIPSNSQVSIGMTLASDGTDINCFPDWYLLNMCEVVFDTDEYSLSYIEYSSWDGGFNGALTLTSTEVVEDWSLSFCSEYQITTVSNAFISVDDNDVYSLKNDGNNQIFILKHLYILVSREFLIRMLLN